ncbi:MAG: DUF4926 domain-containing protein [Acidobacteriota bacterium]
MRELETVVLTRDIPEHGLHAGDIGAIVHDYGEAGYEVEFVSAGGKTVALLTLNAVDIRAPAGKEILHVRRLASA